MQLGSGPASMDGQGKMSGQSTAMRASNSARGAQMVAPATHHRASPLQEMGSIPGSKSFNNVGTSSEYGHNMIDQSPAMTSSLSSHIMLSGQTQTGDKTNHSTHPLVESLIQRLVKRLPHSTGESLTAVESSPLTCSCVANLVRHSRNQLPIILRELLVVFETLNKASLSMSDERVQIDIMQSQLLMLQILDACVIEYWRFSTARPERSEQAKRTPSSQDDIPQGWTDPPAIEENLAKQLLATMTLFLRQMTTREDTLTAQNAMTEGRFATPEKQRSRDDEYDIGVEGATFAALALTHGTGLFILHPTFPPVRSPFPVTVDRAGQTTWIKKPQFVPEASQSTVSPKPMDEQDPPEKLRVIIHSIYRQASQVIFFLSSSNWSLVASRIKSRLLFLTNPNDESSTTSELRLMECSNLNQKRLAAVIQEVNAVFPRLRRQAQHTIALVLRRSIWTWIQYNPAEFAYLYATGRRLDGSADQLFDHIYSLVESTKKKLIYWPVLTSLLIVCPDSISATVLLDGRRAAVPPSKKTAFIETLRKSVRTAKVAEVAALCCIDLCKAATLTATNDASIRRLVRDVCEAIQEKLFDPRRAFTYLPNSIEIPLLVEAFVALYRLDDQRALKELLPNLMNDSNPVAFKIALVKGCIQMASERNRLPWNSNVAPLIAKVSAPLRLTFKNNLVRSLRQDNLGSLPKRSKVKSEEVAARNELLGSIIYLWTTDPLSASYGVSTNVPDTLSSASSDLARAEEEVYMQAMLQSDSVFALAYALTLAATSPEFGVINRVASDTITQAVSRRESSVHSQLKAASQASSVLLSTSFSMRIAQNLVSSSMPLQQRHWLPILSGSLVRKLSILTPEMNRTDSERHLYLPTHDELNQEGEEIGKALLATLCSIDTGVCVQTLQACAEFARYRRQASNYHIFPEEWTLLYEDLGKLADEPTGRVARLRQILSRLRGMKTATAAVMAAWQEVYHRWTAMTSTVVNPQDGPIQGSAQQTASQWHHYSAILASIGGSCMMERHGHAGSAPSPVMQGEGLEDDSIVQLVEAFIQEMVDLLVSDSIWVREKVKDTLGSEMSVHLGGIVLSTIHSVISDFFDRNSGLPQPSETYSQFVEHSISVIQILLGRTSEPTESFLQVDIGALLVLYVEYLNSMPLSEGTVRVRTSMSQICETIMEKRQHFTFNNELRVRNRLFQVLAGWTSDSIEESQISEKMDRLQRDLDAACLRAIAALLDKLPLLLPEDAPLLDDKIEYAKSRQFATHFNYFIKVLNRAKDREERFQSSGERGRKSTTEMGSLRQSAILAISNLLASNIDTGLRHSLPLAYHEDLQLRAAIMQILTNILDKGAAFDRLEHSSSSTENDRLVELICEPNLQLALAVCNVSKGYDETGVDRILLNIFDSKGGVVQFLKAALHEEVERTTTEEMVFRSNSFRTHLLSTYGRTHGYEYLRSILQPLIVEMATKPRGYSYEIDPQKLDPDEMVIVNQHRLEEIAQTFIDKICDSAHQVPAVLRELCRHIRLLMDHRFPASRYQGVGGFIFLRFINPAVVAPQIIDIDIPNTSKETRRGLLLVSKILQTLASNTLFPQHKEPFMTSLNDFLKRNVWKITTFLDRVSDRRTDAERVLLADQPMGSGVQPYGFGIDAEDKRQLHRFFFDNADRIGADLAQRANQAEADAASLSLHTNDDANFDEITSNNPRRVHDAVCGTLSELGKIKEETDRQEKSAGPPRPNLAEFLRKHHGRNLNEETHRTILREGPRSKEGRRVYYYTAWQQTRQTVDYESLIYYIITILSAANEPYDLVLDCTGVSPEHLIPASWLNYFMALAPARVINNIRGVLGFNLNTACSLYCRDWLSPTAQSSRLPDGIPWTHVHNQLRFMHMCSLDELETYIDRRNIALDPHTLALTTAPTEMVLDDVSLVWYYKALIPVVFKISQSYLQITTKKKRKDFPNSTGHQNEVFHLADIDDVRPIVTRGDDNTFLLSCGGGSASFVFIARDRSALIQGLRQARARVSKFENAAHGDQLGRALLASDVPGTLLNIALLNSTSFNTQLRVGAYNLLCALSTSFNFGGGAARRRLHSAKGLVLSANSVNFIADISADFASAAPGVTLEFLTSFFEGFERTPSEQRLACLHYVTAWLPNLAGFVHVDRDQHMQYTKRIKEIIRQLIAITVKDQAMFIIMQRSVWVQLSKADELVTVLLDVFTEAAIDSGLHTAHFQRTLDIVVSFSSMNLRGKLLSRLRRVIAKTGQNPAAAHLHKNASWDEIATLACMNLGLSFSSRAESMVYLPELLHVTLLLAGVGDDATRFAIHGTAVNLVHSLCTEEMAALVSRKGERNGREESSTDVGSEAEYRRTSQRLRSLLSRMSSTEMLGYFGLPLTGSELLAESAAEVSTVRAEPDNAAITKLAAALYEIPELAAPSLDAANAWRARIASLVTSKAFQYNPTVQARAFILLGCIAGLTKDLMKRNVSSPQETKPDERVSTLFEVDDDLLYQILVSLRGSVQEWASEGAESTVVSIVICLGQVIQILPDHSRYLPQIFWLGIAIVQYGHAATFKAGVDLLNTTVATIRDRNLASKSKMDFVTFLLDGRYEFHDAATRFDDETGVDFEINFSFGAAALLVKGLSRSEFREATIRLLEALLQISSRHAGGDPLPGAGKVSTEQLGFFVALLPTVRNDDDLVRLLQLAGLSREASRRASALYQNNMQRNEQENRESVGFFALIESLENKIALLVVTLVSSLLRQANTSDAEKQLLFNFLADSARQFPAIVSILYDQLLPSMRDAYLYSQDEDILRSVDVIAQVAIAEPIFQLQAAETQKRGGAEAYLEEAGYASLLDCSSFSPAKDTRRATLAKLLDAVLNGLIDAGTS